MVLVMCWMEIGGSFRWKLKWKLEMFFDGDSTGKS